jgi:DNA-binding response OmpR family regulator
MKIAVVDDDLTQAKLLCQVLAMDGHICHVFAHGRILVKYLCREPLDLVVLNWNLPGMSGEEVLAWMQRSLSYRPRILCLSSSSQKTEIASTLRNDAADYITKPVATGILVARVRFLLRGASQFNQTSVWETFGDFEFDVRSKLLVLRGTRVMLTQKEFELALLFFRHQNQPLSRAQILTAVWKRDIDATSRTMDTHVAVLRVKLGLRPEHGFRLTPIYGYGYRLERVGEPDFQS